MRPLSHRSPLPLTQVKAAPRVHTAMAGSESDLRTALTTLLDYRWSFAALVCAALLLGAAYAFTAAPVYRSTVVLQMEQKEQLLGGLEELLTNDGPEISTEMELLSSRSLLWKAIDELRLDVVAEPRHFPLVGAALARRYHGTGVRGPVLGMQRLAWGGEQLRVDRLTLPPALEDQPLRLVAGERGTYELRDEDGRALLQGVVGAPAAPAPGAPAGAAMFVSQLVARPGTEFDVTKRSRLVAEEELQRALRMSERGDNTGVLAMSLEGEHPEQPAAILNAIARHYVRQNVEQRSEEAEKTLAFLDTQLPALRTELERAETALSEHRGQRGASVDLGMEAKAVLDRTVELERAISEANMARAELRQRFTPTHPQVEAANNKLAQLQAQRTQLESQLKRLPAAEKQTAQMTRDVRVANEAYLMLSGKAQEYRVLKSSTVANVRVLDPAAVPRKPVRPSKSGVMLVSLLLGVTVGAALAFARRAMNDRVLDPNTIEAALGVPVYATVPLSDEQVRQTRGWRTRSRTAAALPLLARSKPTDLAVESLRSLRTSLQFALIDAPNNVLSITGPSPGVGKSFVAANLASVLADTGKRILLVDADLRAGSLHRYFSTHRLHGLSEVISGTVELAKAVRTLPDGGLSFLPTGILPPNPSELLMSDKFQALLAQMSAGYDLVVIDTPPILAVADGAIVGRHAGVNLVVVRAGTHPLREIAATLGRLEQNGVLVQGVVFNGVPRGVLGRAAYGVYQYEYPGAGMPAGAAT